MTSGGKEDRLALDEGDCVGRGDVDGDEDDGDSTAVIACVFEALELRTSE